MNEDSYFEDGEDGEVEFGKPINTDLEVLSEYAHLPCRFICTQDELLRLADMRVARVIMVKDPLGHCRGLLDKALDAFNVVAVVKHMVQVLETRGYDGDVVILDVRRLPHRPRRPWNKLLNVLQDFVTFTRSTVILYTDDVFGRPRWINIDRVNILCKSDHH